MNVFLYFVFIIFGMIVGAAAGGAGVSLAGGIVGFFVFMMIDRSGKSRHPAPSENAASSADELRREVRELRRELAQLATRVDTLSHGPAFWNEPRPETQAAEEPAAQPMVSPIEAVQEEAPAPIPEPAYSAPAEIAAAETLVFVEIPAEKDATPRFNPFEAARNWLFGGNALVRVGIVVLFFGVAFLVKFAAEHAVLPIEVRYIGIALAAMVALVLGWRLRTSRPEYAMALQGLGVAILYLVTFAAFRLHGLLPGSLTMAILVGVCVLSAALAILQDARSLAVVGICGGFLAPILASTGGGNHVVLFSYYALLNAGILGIAWFKAWRPLNVLGFFLTFGLGCLWGSHNYRDEIFNTTEPFLVFFFFLYLVVSLLYAGRRKAELSQHAMEIAGERIDYMDGTLVFGTPLAAFGLQYLMVKDMAYGSAFSALGLGLIYLPLATILYRRERDEYRLLVESFLALGVIFASLAIPLGLDAKWTSAAWAAEGAGIFWVGIRQQRPAARAFALLLEFGSGVSLVMSLRQPGLENFLGLVPMFQSSFLGPVFVGLAATLTAELIRRNPDRVTDSETALEPLITMAGLGFLNLAFPTFLDQTRSGLAVSLSGAVILLVAERRGHGAAMAFGALFQLIGGIAFRISVSEHTETPLFNLFWLGSVLIGIAGLVSSWRVRQTEGLGRVAVIGLAWSLLWWWNAGHQEISNHLPNIFVLAALIGLATLTALLLLYGGRRAQWKAAEAASMLLLPTLLLCGLAALAAKAHPAADGGWLAWPVAIALMLPVLRRQENGPLALMLNTGHGFALLLTVFLATHETWWWFHELGEPGSAWPVLGWALSPLAAIALLNSEALRARWPLAAFTRTYGLAAIPVIAGLWLWVFFANTVSDGSANPLPYLPVANPIDLATAGSLLMILAWMGRWRGESEHGHLVKILLAATAFYWLNGLLLRTLHQWADVPFHFAAMMNSTLVQASLSLFWAAIALALMLVATRRHLRTLWLTGGGLMAGVVVKLFVVDLSRVGTVERIVSFIGVGLLMLVIGYFSPVPPGREEQA